MYCGFCGNEILNGTGVCPNCNRGAVAAAESRERKKRKSKGFSIMLLAALCVIALIAINVYCQIRSQDIYKDYMSAQSSYKKAQNEYDMFMAGCDEWMQTVVPSKQYPNEMTAAIAWCCDNEEELSKYSEAKDRTKASMESWKNNYNNFKEQIIYINIFAVAVELVILVSAICLRRRMAARKIVN